MPNRPPIWVGDKYEHVGLLGPGNEVRESAERRVLTAVSCSVSGDICFRLEYSYEDEAPTSSLVNVPILTAKELIHDGVWKQVFGDAR